MNIHLENINLQSTSGPNHFAHKLIGHLGSLDFRFKLDEAPDAYLCFIESHRRLFDKTPTFQRLDGIYFNKVQNFQLQNVNIQRTYSNATGVIFQSKFNRDLVTRYFGEHNNSVVIHNGADVDKITQVDPISNQTLDNYENVWCCAASWRPHKRLRQNVDYFLTHAGLNDCLIVAGEVKDPSEVVSHDRVFYVGNLSVLMLYALYRRAKYFIHLAWLDHCPNVVVDARAAGCHIVCSSAGGTSEIAGPNATVVEEDVWDFEPVDLYNPPELDFSRKINNTQDVEYNMSIVAKKYAKFMKESL